MIEWSVAYLPDSSSSSQSQVLVLFVMLILGNMFTKDCSMDVSNVRQTVVEVWLQHPQLQLPVFVFVV